MRGAAARARYNEYSLVVCQLGCLSATGSLLDHLITVSADSILLCACHLSDHLSEVSLLIFCFVLYFQKS